MAKTPLAWKLDIHCHFAMMLDWQPIPLPSTAPVFITPSVVRILPIHIIVQQLRAMDSFLGASSAGFKRPLGRPRHLDFRFTLHFLPNGAFDGHTPTHPPSLFDDKLEELLESSKDYDMSGVSIKGKSWTNRGDLLMTVTTDASEPGLQSYQDVSNLLLHLNIFEWLLRNDKDWAAAHPGEFQLRGEGDPESLYLCIGGITEDVLPKGWVLQEAGAHNMTNHTQLRAAVLGLLKVPHTLPDEGFWGRTVSSGQRTPGKRDCYIDLSYFENITDRLRCKCPRKVYLSRQPLASCGLGEFPGGAERLKSIGGHEVFISFVELKDNTSQ